MPARSPGKRPNLRENARRFFGKAAQPAGKCPHVPRESGPTCGKMPAGSPRKRPDLREKDGDAAETAGFDAKVAVFAGNAQNRRIRRKNCGFRRKSPKSAEFEAKVAVSAEKRAKVQNLRVGAAILSYGGRIPRGDGPWRPCFPPAWGRACQRRGCCRDRHPRVPPPLRPVDYSHR